MRDPRNPALEAQILADPDDPAAYLVYADWLAAQGDPRGELIMLQHAGHPGAAAFLDQHLDRFLGPLAARLQPADAQPCVFGWRHGFIHSARIAVGHACNGDLGEIVGQLLDHPSGRFLQELTLGMPETPDLDACVTAVQALVARAPLPLRGLHAVDVDRDEWTISWLRLGDLSPAWPGLPELRRLIVQGGWFELGQLVLPALRHAEFRTGGLRAEDARAIAAATWPAIEHLEVWYGTEAYGGDATVDDVAALLTRTDLPRLRSLGLKNTELSDALVARLPGTALLPQLRRLDLSMGTLTDDGALTLAIHRDDFAHLEVLDVSANHLSQDAIDLLAGLAGTVITADQKGPAAPDDRYVSVGE